MGLRGFALLAMGPFGMISQPGLWGRTRVELRSVDPHRFWTPNLQLSGSMNS